MIVVGVVAEGAHDLIMLPPLAKHELVSHFGEDDIKFINLQPTQDSTGSFSGGGWSRVAAWCQNYAGAQIETFFTPLFAGQDACDAIIVHLDGDILEQLAPHTSLNVPNPVGSKGNRVSLTVKIVEEWLSVSSPRRSRIAIAVPVLHTECWYIALDGYSAGDPEVTDAKVEFRKSYNHKTGQKLYNFYEQSVARIIEERKSEVQTESFAAFRDELRALSF